MQTDYFHLCDLFNNLFIILQYEHKVYGTKKTRTELSVAVNGIRVVRKEDVKRGWITQHVKFLAYL